MKILITLALLPCVIMAEEELKNYSYYRGYEMYQDWIIKSEIKLDYNQVLEGMRDASEGKKLDLKEEDYIVIQKSVQDKLSVDNLINAELYLKEIDSQPNMIQLVKDKLYYEVLNEGNGTVMGEKPSLKFSLSKRSKDENVMLIDEEKPIPIYVESTIEGFRLGVTGMKEGEKRRLYIHPDLGYGDMHHYIAPNLLVIYEVEVIKADT